MRTIVEGLGYIRGNRLVTAVLVVTIFANLFGFSYASMVPVIGERVLGLDALGIGMLMSCEGGGALLAALVLTRFVTPRRYAPIFFSGVLLALAMVLAFSLSTRAELSMLALFLGGCGMAGFAAMQSTILLVATTPEMRSRIMGVLVMCIGAGPLGILLMGLLAERFGASAAVSAMTCAGVVTLLVSAWMWPELRRVGALPIVKSDG